MARKHRPEKYIEQREGSLRVKVVTTYKGKKVNLSGGTFRFKNYTSQGACWKAALEARDAILKQIEAQTIIYDEPTVEDLFRKRTDYIVLSQESQRKHDIIFKHGIGSLANRKISTITAADIQRSLNRYGETHSTSAVKHLLSIWRQIYRVCAIEELPIPDKTQAVMQYESKVVPKKRETRITHEQFQTFIDYLSSYGTDNPVTRYRCEAIYYALMIQLYAGLRPQEAYALFREDIDLEQGLLHIRRRCGTTASEQRQIITLKTADSCADVPIADALVPYLEDMLKRYDTAPLLADHDGLPFDTKVVCTLIHNISEKAHVHFTQYMLRHLFAKEMSQVTDVKTLQSLMRHARADMSLYYSWADDDEKKNAVNSRNLS